MGQAGKCGGQIVTCSFIFLIPMKHTLLSFSFLLFFLPSLHAQFIVNPPSLDFGDVLETETDTLWLTVVNPLADTIHVSEVRFYDFYGEAAFSTTDTAFDLPTGSARMVPIVFSPRHNVYHNSEVLFINDSGKGSTTIDIRGQGKYSNSYYDGTENLDEQALKDTLKDILGDGYVQLSYNAARDQMFMIIDNWSVNGQGAAFNKLEGVYTGQTLSGYINRTDAQNQGYNTEHTIPQSLFSSAFPMQTDLNHLFITRATANSQRANYPFGVANDTLWTQGGSILGINVFEPRDKHKGTVARSMMYFVTRYQDYNDGGGSPFYAQQDSILRVWHKQFPPTAVERKRNQDIFAVQKNRNPFIDYPQFTERISTLGDPVSVAPDRFWLDRPDTLIHFGDITAGSMHSFYYVMVNAGNKPVSISGIALNDTALSFSGFAGPDTVLQPGDGLTLLVKVTAPMDTVMGELSYSTDIPSVPSVSVPVISYTPSPPPTAIRPDVLDGVSLYPNPVENMVNLKFIRPLDAAGQYELTDGGGKTLIQGSIPAGVHSLSLRTSQLAAGIYFFRLTSGGKLFSRKLLRQ
jgi:hypothetical protein